MNPTPTIAWFDSHGTPLPLEPRAEAWTYDGCADPSDRLVRVMKHIHEVRALAESEAAGWLD